MPLRIDVYHHDHPRPDCAPGALDTAMILAAIEGLRDQMSALQDEIAGLTQDVAAENTAIDSALTLLAGIPDVVAAAVSDALAQANADDATAQAAVAAARKAVQDETGKLQAALTTPGTGGTAGAPAGGATDTGATDTGNAGSTGSPGDSSSGSPAGSADTGGGNPSDTTGSTDQPT